MATRATSVQITMPQMGESVTEGIVLGWLKQVGDRVEADEPLVEISTDKVDAEVPAPVSGTLVNIAAEADETVQVGSVLGEIEPGGDGAAPAAPEEAPVAGETAPAAGETAPAAGETAPAAGETAPAAGDGAPAAGDGAPPAGGEVVDVAFPEMGDSVAEGTVLEWRVKPGDAVGVDDPLVEISTDKVDAELPSPVAGTIAEILVDADETVAVGSVLCRIAAGAGAEAAGHVQPSAEPTEVRPAATPMAAGNGGNATPVAARIASVHGLDLDSVRGTGPRGRVTKEDVLAAIEGNGAPSAGAPAAPEGPTPEGAETKPIRGPAATLVEFMNASRSIPTATSFRTLPVDVLDARRRELKARGKKLSFTHLIAWAIARAAREMAVMGHAYAEEGGKPQRVTPATISLGLAVDVERRDGTRSLVVPVLKDASEMGFADFAVRYDELVAGARENTFPPDAYQGANITLTNPGGL